MKSRYYAAAGGIVVRGGEVLLLYKHRQGEYVLPKGHIEEGESLEQTALRETREETGYAHARLLTNLGTLQAQYAYKGRWTVRDETYFLMQLLDEARVEPADYDDAQHDLDAFHQLWVPVDSAAGRLTFEPAKTFAARAAAWLQANALPSAPA
jgi:8-oxo-dGTP pyrophosphatase MutT (NUDIX family)